MRRIAAAALLLAMAGGPAFAHLDPAEHGSLAAGLSHPVTGLDHILAMITVGIWAALIGGRARWMVPSAFVAAMLAGFAAALAGVPLPFVEPAVLASVIVLGLFAALALRVPLAVGMVTVALFAVFHGHAHGTGLPTVSDPVEVIAYVVGFLMSTAGLHVIGALLGYIMLRNDRGALLLRGSGALIALSGVFFLMGSLNG